jgi:cysteine-rich repeat protein
VGADGIPCTANADCAGGFCITEIENGWPSGSCSGVCVLATDDCPGGGSCTDLGNGDGTGYCLVPCSQASECRDGYGCSDAGGLGATLCLPSCTDKAQCPTVHYCDPGTGLCSAPELDCSDNQDNDGDGAIDCEDSDCAATCEPQVTAACADAPAAQASNAGDTVSGTRLFSGSCTGSGSHEQVYSFTPGAAGEVGALTLVLQSATDQGIYLRAACGDPSTEIACRDAHVGGIDEPIERVMNGGEPLWIFVDGYEPGHEGAYTLSVSFQVAVCGDGLVTPPEVCDDGGVLPGDGCAADCTPELDLVCAAAPAAQLGANAGDTADGNNYFGGSCTGVGDAHEDIYQFTPPGDGTLSLVLSSATDQGLYVLTDCSDSVSELGCAEATDGGADETLDVQVTGGAPVVLVVDGFLSQSDNGPYTLTVTFTP